MSEILTRIFSDMGDRLTGPMHFRIYLQPAMAIIFATIDGLKDARTGRSPYFWSLLSDPAHRAEMAKDGWKSIGKVFILAMILDAIYQFIVQRFIYPGEMILIAILLALLPYLLLRGLVTRLASRLHQPRAPRV